MEYTTKKLHLATLFTDNMVIQRSADFRLFGKADEDGTVEVSFGNVTHAAPVSKGPFCLTFPPLPDTRETLTVAVRFGGEVVCELHNVVMGEVWIAGGQSNMEMPTFAVYNGFEDAESLSDPDIRLFTVPRRPFPNAHISNWHFESCVSDDTPWQVCEGENALHFSAAGFYFAAKLHRDMGVPVGVISCNWGGTCIETWMNFETVENADAIALEQAEADGRPYVPGASAKAEYYKKVMQNLDMDAYLAKYNAWQEAYCKAAEGSDAVRDAREQGADGFARHAHMGSVDVWQDYGPYDPNRPGCLYDNMLLRIAPYSVKGALWYQGESNGGAESRHYAHLFRLMRNDWDELWGFDTDNPMPFMVVEIAPFGNTQWNGTKTDAWGYLREQQRIADDEGTMTALIQTGDTPDEWNIHPCSKRVVGERLACAAENVVYGMDVSYSGPVCRRVRTGDGGMYVTFEHCEGGLAIRGGERLLDFHLAGDDGVYHDAEADIVSPDTVFVHAPKLPEPKQIRAGFCDFPTLNLTNGIGLPASPFRWGE